jgi:hypothetical protein
VCCVAGSSLRRDLLNFLGLADSDDQVSLNGLGAEVSFLGRFSCERDHFRSLFLPRDFSIFRENDLPMWMNEACQSSLVTDGKWVEAVWF